MAIATGVAAYVWLIPARLWTAYALTALAFVATVFFASYLQSWIGDNLAARLDRLPKLADARFLVRSRTIWIAAIYVVLGPLLVAALYAASTQDLGSFRAGLFERGLLWSMFVAKDNWQTTVLVFLIASGLFAFAVDAVAAASPSILQRPPLWIAISLVAGAASLPLAALGFFQAKLVMRHLVPAPVFPSAGALLGLLIALLARWQPLAGPAPAGRAYLRAVPLLSVFCAGIGLAALAAFAFTNPGALVAFATPASCREGTALFRSRQLDAAVRTLTDCLDFPALGRDTRREALYFRAWANFDLGYTEAAIADWRSRLEVRGSGDPTELVTLSRFLRKAGRLQESLDAVLEAEKMEPLKASPSTLYQKGSVLFDLKRYPEALEAFDTSLKVQSGYVVIYVPRGLVKEALGDKEAAQRDFETAAQKFSGKVLNNTERGQLLILRQKLEEYGVQQKYNLPSD